MCKYDVVNVCVLRRMCTLREGASGRILARGVAGLHTFPTWESCRVGKISDSKCCCGDNL